MSFRAKYRDECAECGGEIRKGDECSYTGDFEIRHTVCPDTDTAPSRRAPICPECHLEKSLSGDCDCA